MPSWGHEIEQLIKGGARPETPEEWSRRQLWRSLHDCKKRARNKGIPFSLDIGFVDDWMKEHGNKCCMTGIEFQRNPGVADTYIKDEHYNPRVKRMSKTYAVILGETYSEGKWHRNPYRPSFDRIDSSKGYTPDNVRIIAYCVNTAMNEWGEDILKLMSEGYQKNGKAKKTRKVQKNKKTKNSRS
jgi:hypothetical protein